MSQKQWRRERKTWNIDWTEKNGAKRTSRALNYSLISNSIREKGHFEPADWALPRMECFWLDGQLDLGLDFHAHDHNGDTLGIISGMPQQQFGARYPIKPKLEREGQLLTTIQPQLVSWIIAQRKKLIEGSKDALTFPWLFELRSLIGDTISLVDVTLTQTYIKAQFDPDPDWVFNQAKLGARHGRRLNDKLKWVYQVTGKNLDIEPERHSLETLRKLRNHLMHFDPPSLVVTVEEATMWLNQIIDVGQVLVKIRHALGVPPSTDLLNFLLQPEAQFHPRNILAARSPAGTKPDADYSSTTWPSVFDE
ncbi:MAG: hypothetical protein JNL43_15405 [Flavobacteriales bacterium]|nr:hypothetical protein [Flavobacteriales bacterium]